MVSQDIRIALNPWCGFRAVFVGAGRAAAEPTADDLAQTVLVVDDDSRLRDLLCTVLAPLNCAIVPAGSGDRGG